MVYAEGNHVHLNGGGAWTRGWFGTNTLGRAIEKAVEALEIAATPEGVSMEDTFWKSALSTRGENKVEGSCELCGLSWDGYFCTQ